MERCGRAAVRRGTRGNWVSLFSSRPGGAKDSGVEPTVATPGTYSSKLGCTWFSRLRRFLRPVRGGTVTTRMNPRVALRPPCGGLRCTRGYMPAPLRGERLGDTSQALCTTVWSARPCHTHRLETGATRKWETHDAHLIGPVPPSPRLMDRRTNTARRPRSAPAGRARCPRSCSRSRCVGVRRDRNR